MSRYRLMPPEGTCTFRKIMCGRKWVGRVYRHADGTWRCAMYKCEQASAATPAQAFDEGVAKYLGFANAAALWQHNATVRAYNRQRRASAQHALNQIMQGNFRPFDELFRKGN